MDHYDEVNLSAMMRVDKRTLLSPITNGDESYFSCFEFNTKFYLSIAHRPLSFEELTDC